MLNKNRKMNKTKKPQLAAFLKLKNIFY